ncbi:hypothetical protein GF325_03405 [Candidatus Bathyarchaeota archaeon]|nr:hypothetical protein [Candidatus Bathyarchaeota archaeon]
MFKKEAVQSFKQTIKLDKSCDLAYISLNKLYRDRKDYFKAMVVLADLVHENPTSPLLRQTVIEILESGLDVEIEEIFKIQPEILIELLQNAEDDDFKYKMTGLLKNISVERPELYSGKAFNIIRELAESSDNEIRSTAYVILVAAYEANPRTIETLGLDLIEKGLKDQHNYIQRSTGGLLKSMLDYFPNYLAGRDDLIIMALENPQTASTIMKVLPKCPKCRSIEDVYLQKINKGDKILRFYCEKCELGYFKSPGSNMVQEIEKSKKKFKGPIICPSCKGQFLKWIEEDAVYNCSVCSKYFTV